MTKLLATLLITSSFLFPAASAYGQSQDKLPGIKIEANCLEDNSCGKLLADRYKRVATKAELYCFEKLLARGYLEEEIRIEEPCRQLATDKAKRSKTGIDTFFNEVVDDWNRAAEVERRKK